MLEFRVLPAVTLQPSSDGWIARFRRTSYTPQIPKVSHECSDDGGGVELSAPDNPSE